METVSKAGRYEIVGELGRGAMGIVYKAVDPVIGRTVAVKTIRLSEEGTGLNRAELLARFQTEARAAGLLTHPNIVVVYDAGEEDGLYYITMELVEGKSLQVLLDGGHSFPLSRTLRSEEHTSELQSPCNLVCRLLLEKKTHHPPPDSSTLESYHPQLQSTHATTFYPCSPS